MITTFILLTLATAMTVDGYRSYMLEIPNGNLVPNPCPEGGIWSGVGHQSPAGSNMRNSFGLDFKTAGFKWTPELCRKDSDGDGLTNGQELGDPDCVWRSGNTPARSTGLSHPGICPLDSKTCVNAWTVCPKAFNCSAFKDANVTMRNFTINRNTPVPAKDTTYICQAFELNNTATPVHMIGSLPIIVNQNVMHHMIMYACNSRPEQSLFDGPKECFMGNSGCQEILNLWAYGVDGECFNSQAGFRIGGNGYRYALLELHWNNPTLQTTYTDSSGFSLFMTPNLRRYDQGTAMYGETNLVLPQQQSLIRVNHTCPSACTMAYHSGTRYITAAIIHMHTYGIRGRISLWRSGVLIKDLSPLQVYDYNSPQMVVFDPPIEYRPGDDVKTECYFNTSRSNKTVFFGESTSDEMCLSFLSYYPNNVAIPAKYKLAECLALSGINLCYFVEGITPHVEQDCNITGMMNGAIPNRVLAEMTTKKCFARTGCDAMCRDYLNNTLFPSNACYDPKRARQMSEVLALNFIPNPASANISATLYGQRFCEQEIRMLAEMDRQALASAVPTTAPAATTTAPTAPTTATSAPTTALAAPTTSTANQVGGAPNRLTSEHLLIIIIVCSCLGFIIIIAVLGVLASKCHVGSASHNLKAAPSGDSSRRANAYAVYENEAAK